MADVFTTSSVLLSVQDAYDRYARFALRPLLHFDRLATVKPKAQAMPGDVVIFTLYADLPTATATLNEVTDVEVVAMDDNQVSVTLLEKGNAVATTRKLRGTSFLDVERDKANIVGFNAGLSMDEIARDVVASGTNVSYSGTATARNEVDNGTSDATARLKASDVRLHRARLVGANVVPWDDGLYRAYAHPDTLLDLRAETGADKWRDPNTYGQSQEDIWNGTIGAFEGFDFIEAVRAPIFLNASSGVGGAGAIDVYASFFCGQECLAKAWSMSESGELPNVEIGPVTDRLNRIRTLGWYWLGGYAVFRQEALRRHESSSSIATNV